MIAAVHPIIAVALILLGLVAAGLLIDVLLPYSDRDDR